MRSDHNALLAGYVHGQSLTKGQSAILVEQGHSIRYEDWASRIFRIKWLRAV